MRTKRIVAAFTLATTFLTAACVAQARSAIRVRVLNAKNGKPLKGVGVFLVDPETVAKRRANREDPAAGAPNGVSQSDGSVLLTLPVPTPGKFLVWYSGGQCGMALCSDNKQPYSTSEILEVGVVTANTCDSKSQFGQTPRPGEVFVFGKPLTSTDCVLREIP